MMPEDPHNPSQFLQIFRYFFSPQSWDIRGFEGSRRISEELETNYVIDQNLMQFDNWVLIGYTSTN